MNRFGRNALLFGVLAASVSCNTSARLVLSISNVPSDTAAIKVSLAIDQKTYEIDPPLQFDSSKNGTSILSSVEIPFEFSSKQVSINVLTQSGVGNKCLTSAWSGTAAVLEAGTYSLSAPLQRIEDDKITNDLYTILSISETEVWVGGSSGTLAKWDGCYWRNRPFLDGVSGTAITKLYSHNKTGIWALGGSGSIAKYDSAKDAWMPIDVSSAINGTGETIYNITWSGITYLEGSSADLLVVGSAPNPNIMPGATQCFAIRISPSGSSYVPTRISTPFCGYSAQTCTQFGMNQNLSCYFVAQNAYSFPPDRVVLSGISYFAAGNYTGFGIYDNRLQPIGAAPNPQYVTSAGNATEPLGVGGLVWGTSINDFWLGANHFYHILNANNSMMATSNRPVAIETMLYRYNFNNYKVISMWGALPNDFWVIGFPSSRFAQVNHFVDKPGLALSESSIGVINYLAGIDNYPLTNVTGTSNKDVWFSGYGGIRIRYDGASFRVFK